MIRNTVRHTGTNKELSGLETYHIWNETGFFPSVYYISLIEMLHQADSSAYIIPDDLILHAIQNLENETISGCGSYKLYSREKMINFAGICGIYNNNSDISDDNYLMAKITESLISDYLSLKKQFKKVIHEPAGSQMVDETNVS
ncbi:hypothetical protein [Methanoplanus endosymbiosus]|uniref:Uncharacterized protein n=1 Tax=Methanoplanus endosymbiosus TaxID=33865 RepID=A0A9E7PMR7_9EURY|nr:hypothetical protein [Methanoplanus endosymbiosus]UUX93098.1 hypothetical protein L6E24_02965 [Methanoplanus endosymbiosus]